MSLTRCWSAVFCPAKVLRLSFPYPSSYQTCRSYRIGKDSNITNHEPDAELGNKLNLTLAPLETRWQASPHLQILTSPLRRCLITQKVLPNLLMVQLKPVRLPNPESSPSLEDSPAVTHSQASKQSTPSEVLLPDQILHPQLSRKKAGKGVWVTLNKTILNQMRTTGAYRMLAPKAIMPEKLDQFITSQLIQRVLQEFQLLSQHASSKTVQKDDSLSLLMSPCTSVQELQERLQQADEYGRPFFSFGLQLNPLPNVTDFSNTPSPTLTPEQQPDDTQKLQNITQLPVQTHIAVVPSHSQNIPVDQLASTPLYYLDRMLDAQNLADLSVHIQNMIHLKSNSDNESEKQPKKTHYCAVSHSSHSAPLAIALWRLSLWSST